MNNIKHNVIKCIDHKLLCADGGNGRGAGGGHSNTKRSEGEFLFKKAVCQQRLAIGPSTSKEAVSAILSNFLAQ